MAAALAAAPISAAPAAARRLPATPTVVTPTETDEGEDETDDEANGMEDEPYEEVARGALVDTMHAHNHLITNLLEQQQQMLTEIDSERERLHRAGLLPASAIDEPTRCIYGVVA